MRLFRRTVDTTTVRPPCVALPTGCCRLAMPTRRRLGCSPRNLPYIGLGINDGKLTNDRRRCQVLAKPRKPSRQLHKSFRIHRNPRSLNTRKYSWEIFASSTPKLSNLSSRTLIHHSHTRIMQHHDRRKRVSRRHTHTVRNIETPETPQPAIHFLPLPVHFRSRAQASGLAPSRLSGNPEPGCDAVLLLLFDPLLLKPREIRTSISRFRYCGAIGSRVLVLSSLPATS